MKALVVGADALSRWVDWDDRNVCILFGDGAGAMVLESTPRDDPAHAGLLGYVMRSDGAGSVHLNCKYVNVRGWAGWFFTFCDVLLRRACACSSILE